MIDNVLVNGLKVVSITILMSLPVKSLLHRHAHARRHARTHVHAQTNTQTSDFHRTKRCFDTVAED